jgi:pimeloyl-ACP methyl ester carboxylesterase
MRQNPDAAAQRAIPDPALRRRTLAHPVAGPLLKALQLSDRLRKRLPGTINDTALFSRLNDLPLDEITAPVLVVHGRADSVVPFSHAEAVARRAPRAEMLAVEEGEHVVLFTHLEAVRAATARFIETHLQNS